MTTTLLTVDAYELPRLKARRARLCTLIACGDHAGANTCADLILDLIGLRTFRLEDCA